MQVSIATVPPYAELLVNLQRQVDERGLVMVAIQQGQRCLVDGAFQLGAVARPVVLPSWYPFWAWRAVPSRVGSVTTTFQQRVTVHIILLARTHEPRPQPKVRVFPASLNGRTTTYEAVCSGKQGTLQVQTEVMPHELVT